MSRDPRLDVAGSKSKRRIVLDHDDLVDEIREIADDAVHNFGDYLSAALVTRSLIQSRSPVLQRDTFSILPRTNRLLKSGLRP